MKKLVVRTTVAAVLSVTAVVGFTGSAFAAHSSGSGIQGSKQYCC